MDKLRKTVLIGAAALFAAWLAFHFRALTADQNGLVRFVLGLVFAWMVLTRRGRSSEDPATQNAPVGAALLMGAAGTFCAIAGAVLDVGQMEWVGLLAVLGGCLIWARPAKSRDSILALVLLYWMHPLPGQVFGPFQLLMQRFSVQGAEWLLHVLNQRVWADGLVLRTGFEVFEVPAMCSGMATAVTVLLTALAVGIFFRFPWFHVFMFTVLGVAQVLLLNVLRISMMVMLSSRKPPDWPDRYLHDSMGVFLLAAVALIVLEAIALRLRHLRRIRQQHVAEREEAEGTALVARQHMTSRKGRAAKLALLVVLAVLLAAGLAWRRRPYHRGRMIAGTVDGLRLRDLEAAERATDLALRLAGDDLELSITRVQILIQRRKYAEALEEAKLLPATEQQPVGLVLQSLGLLGLEQPAEAEVLIARLPDYVMMHPEVLLLRAELASARGDTAEVVKTLLQALDMGADIERIRRFFPFLARVGRWDIITRCRDDARHLSPVQAMLAIRAHVETGQIAMAGRILKDALKQWPEDADFVGYVAMMAASGAGRDWEERFVERLEKVIDSLDVDKLAVCMDAAYRIKRPEVAGEVKARLLELDPRDPGLLLAEAEHGPPADRKDALQLCLAELDRRRAAGKLTERLMMLVPRALRLAGRTEDAHARLEEILKRYPSQAVMVGRERAILYEEAGDYEKVYEVLWQTLQREQNPPLPILAMQVRALLHLNMPAYAMVLAQRAQRVFPDSPEVRYLLADIWRGLGYHEEALFAMESDNRYLASPVVAELLEETGRLREAERARRIMGIARPAGRKAQPVTVPRAEWVIKGQWPPPYTGEEMQREAAVLEREIEDSSSPYIRNTKQLALAWYQSGGRSANLRQWEAAGRDDLEKAMALYRFALLQGRQKQTDSAQQAVTRAIELWPTSAFFWRLNIILSGGDDKIVQQAREACPGDPDIWLAGLLHMLQEGKPGDALAAEIEDAVAAQRFPVGTLVRAGDLLLRRGEKQLARQVTERAINRARGYLPAYLLGIRCALAIDDRTWASRSAIQAAVHARAPTPYYELVAKLRSAERGADPLMAAAAEQLVPVYPDNIALVVRLAEIYLDDGDAKRAFSLLVPVIKKGTRDTGVSAYILAAEAARKLQRFEQAVMILERARALFPTNYVVLNNLVYCLAMDHKTLARAKSLLPGLLKMAPGVFAVQDTAAVVYRNLGDNERARACLEKAQALLDKTNRDWIRINPSAMDLDVYQGNVDEGIDAGLDRFERFKRSAVREELMPLVKEIMGEIEGKKETPNIKH